jgi:hypothetical protein
MSPFLRGCFTILSVAAVWTICTYVVCIVKYFFMGFKIYKARGKGVQYYMAEKWQFLHNNASANKNNNQD